MSDEMKKYTEPNNLAIIVNEKEVSDFVTEGNFVNPNKMMAIQLLGYEETKKIWDLGLGSGNEFGITFQREFALSSGALATHEEIEQANKLKDSLYEKYQSLEQKQAYLSKYNAPASNKPMQSVQSLEEFFGREFSSAELARAIEEMGFYSDEIKSAYHLENDPNAERTYVFGTLAANAIIDIHEEKGMKLNDEAAEEIYKIGIEVAQNKYGSYSELEPKLEKIFGNEKNIRPYSKDMRNLNKALESFYSQQSQTEDGKVTGVFTNVWVDNWRIATDEYDEKWQFDERWRISFKGTPVIFCVDNAAFYTASDYVLADAHLNIGDVLQMVEEKTGIKCPQIDPKVNVEKHYIPSNFVEQNEDKVRGEKSAQQQQKKETKHNRARESIER